MAIIQMRKRVMSSIRWLRMFLVRRQRQMGSQPYGVLRQRYPTVELHTELTPEALANCEMQLQSPLFGKLPAELRNIIFDLATQPYDDPRFQYAEPDFYDPLSYHARHTYSTALLLTCRRAWLETNRLPLRNAEPTFLFYCERRRAIRGHSRRPYSQSYGRHMPIRDDEDEQTQFVMMLTRLTPLNRENLQRIRIFAKGYWLEWYCFTHLLNRVAFVGGVLPPMITVTIRHEDWRMTGVPRMNDDWIKELLICAMFKTVMVFRLELETLKQNREKMRALADRISCNHRLTSCYALDEGDSTPVMTRRGPTNIGGREWALYRGVERLEYEVVTLVWKRRSEQES